MKQTRELTYPCLILDHDETVVDSTRTIHYPAFRKALKELRPNVKAPSLEEFLGINFHPGFFHYLEEELRYNPEELKKADSIWREYTKSITPKPFPGIKDLLLAFSERGGIITVVSHSVHEIILRDYKHIFEGNLEPDLICGWVNEPEKVKPNPYPLEMIMKTFNLGTDEALVVDDLKPGLTMARSVGVPFAGAGWGHQIPEIRDYMKRECDYYFSRVKDFRNFILSE